MQVRRWIEVKFTKEGIHKYPEAATKPELADVSFLSHPHRHIFHFYVSLEVMHTNREIEFIQLKRWLEKNFNDGVLDVNYKSCEMLAADVYTLLQTHADFKDRPAVIKVYEDDENGAVLTYDRPPQTKFVDPFMRF